MKWAIIDLGSNTIRTVVYEICKNEYKSILNKGVFAGIISFVKDGKMSDEGIEKIISVLCEMKSITDSCDKTLCFATASLRFIENKIHVADEVKKRTGIEIMLLSAREEAYYDYLGIREIQSAGTAGDLGGGSCQMFSFDTSGLTYSCSMPIGGLLLHTQAIAGVLPLEDEVETIKSKVRKELYLHNNLKKFEEIYMSGGSIRSLNEIMGNKGFCTKTDFESLLKLCLENPYECERIIGEKAKDRLVTIIPAAIVLSEICDFLGCTLVKPVNLGVREGILKDLLKEGQGK